MLRFIVALEAEARPLIAGFRLEREPRSSAFKIFRRDDLALAVSGPGKVAAAAATAFLHQATGGGAAGWLNAGIAGHGERPVGEAVLAHKVRDRATGLCWYPPQMLETSLPTDEVVTVDTVERVFSAGGAHEMEASGFYPTACRFATAELVHCVKVISDGPAAAPEGLSAARVAALVEASFAEIEALATELTALAREVRSLAAPPPELEAMLGRWHFTVTEARQLRRLLERWHVLQPERKVLMDDFPAPRRGRDVLRFLRDRLDAVPVELG